METKIKKKHGYLLVVITIIILAGSFLAYSKTALKPPLKPAPITSPEPAVKPVQAAVQPPQRCHNDGENKSIQPSSQPNVQISNMSRVNDPVRGPVDAPVTIVEFGDFACGFTARAYITMEKLMEEYNGNIRFVYKNFRTMEGWSLNAMVASRCAYNQNDEGFWYFYNELFQARNSNSISKADIDSKVVGWASDANLDVDAFKSCYDTKEPLPEILGNIQEGRELGVTGTPTFFINEKRLDGALPYPAFKEIIEIELEKER